MTCIWNQKIFNHFQNMDSGTIARISWSFIINKNLYLYDPGSAQNLMVSSPRNCSRYELKFCFVEETKLFWNLQEKNSVGPAQQKDWGIVHLWKIQCIFCFKVLEILADIVITKHCTIFCLFSTHIAVHYNWWTEKTTRCNLSSTFVGSWQKLA